MITLVDSEIPFDETQHPFITKFLKTISKLLIENFFNLKNDMYKKLQLIS